MNVFTRSRARRALALAAGVAALLVALPAGSHDADAASSVCTARGVAVKRFVPYGTSLYVLYSTAAPVKAWLGVYEAGTQKVAAVGARWTFHQGTPASPVMALSTSASQISVESGDRCSTMRAPCRAAVNN